MKTLSRIQVRPQDAVGAPDNLKGCDTGTTSTDDRLRVATRRIIDVVGCILCVMTLALALGWMLVQAGIAEMLCPRRFAASGNSDLNALLEAIEFDDVPAARRVLRKQRLDVNTADDAGFPPINYVVRAGGPSAVELVDLLIAAGADANGRGADGVAPVPLHAAVILRRPDLVERLLRAGADVGVTGGDGRTALHSAAECDDPKTAAVLLAAGADPAAADDAGNTPLAVALARGNARTAALLAHDLARDPESRGATRRACAATSRLQQSGR